MILHHEPLDYQRHCATPFGTYVQALDDSMIKNDLRPRTIDCIYLRPSPLHQTGYELLDIRTNRVINRGSFTVVPITQNIIELVHSLSERDNLPTGLKIATRTGHIIYNSTWIAGVDYNESNESNESESNESNESNSNEEEDDEDEDEDYIYEADEDEEHNFDELEPEEIYELANSQEQQELEQDDPSEEDDPNEAVTNDDDEPTEVDSDKGDDNNIITEVEEVKNVRHVEDTIKQQHQAKIAGVRRSTRATKPPVRLDYQNHFMSQTCADMEEYSQETGKVIAHAICFLNKAHINPKSTKRLYSFVETYGLEKGLKKFGDKGYKAAFGEMKQLHDRVCFVPVNVADLTPSEKARAMESLLFQTEKRDGSIKGRTCANGSVQRQWMDREETASPTAATEAILLTVIIDAHESRDVMIADIPNAFIQTPMPKANKGERVIMKIRGSLVDMLVEMSPEIYHEHVVIEAGNKILYVIVTKAIYGMLISALLFYKKLKKDLEEIGFEVNPYDPCIANRMINGKQHTVTWHVDDLKSSHVDSKVNDEFANWLETKYGDPKVGKVKAERGKRHDYLAMKLDLSIPGEAKIDMTDYVKNMVDDFPEELEGLAGTPWNKNLFKMNEKSEVLEKTKAEQFHTFIAKGLFVTKRARPYILPAIAHLCTRVKGPTVEDWDKLKRMMRFLKCTKDDVLTLKAESLTKLDWHIDAAFAVHPDFKSHTGALIALKKGSIGGTSKKQKVNTRSSTEAEIIGMDDTIGQVLWSRLFMEAQGYPIEKSVIKRDNMSSMKLEMNGKASSGKRTRHLNIKYFFITDQIEKEQVKIEYCPTDELWADYMTKPLMGSKFKKFREQIMCDRIPTVRPGKNPIRLTVSALCTAEIAQ
ncbi:hypothetical protein ACA910_017636 [Epithemia clementina (nom. ined.)]